MRDYSKVAPQFWTGDTGKALKKAGPEAVIVAMYLMTSPHANMIGLYYLPMLYIAHDTELGSEGASKGLARGIEAGFCTYDEASEHVFVHAMARFQIGERLAPNDKRCKGVENELAKAPKGPLRDAFVALYMDAFHLSEASPIEAPSKPLGSQEQEQEQEQEQKQKKGKAPRGATADLFPGVDSQVVSDFLELRKSKKAPITATAVAGIQREAEKAGLTLQEALAMCCERGWSGFKADWEGVSRRSRPAANEPATLPRLQA